MAGELSEKHVLDAWQHALRHRTDLVTEENEPLEVVYPGRPNDDRGADLRDAVIITPRGLLQGDIEIHVNASSWWAHRHHRDPAYNRVILHVVFQNDTAGPVILPNGFHIPTLALQKYTGTVNELKIKPMRRLPVPQHRCRFAIPCRNEEVTGKILDEAGAARFDATAARFKESAAKNGTGEALYHGVMTALGYAKNKEAMVELSGRLPLARLEKAGREAGTGEERLAAYQSLLLGTAGLLPLQRSVVLQRACGDEPWVAKLEDAWAALGETETMHESYWRFFKVRPGNYPVRRLAAMSYLLHRFKDGLLEGIRRAMEETEGGGTGNSLERALMVEAEGYWAQHLDFGEKAEGPALLGGERAAEIIINVLLPLAAAGTEYAEKARWIYANYPALPENSLVKHMQRQLGLGQGSVNTARRQQGLIHLYKTACSQGKCEECAIGAV